MADILIRGMTMPRNCLDCKIRGSQIVCPILDRYAMNNKTDRRPDCPLLPLPEGHGRLGDLDALQEEFKKSKGGKRLMLIDTAPTIVPAEGGVKVEKNICFECKYASEYPECPATNDDIVFASNGDTIVSCKAYEETEGCGEDGN